MTPSVLWASSWIKELHTSYENDPPEETVIWNNYRKSSLLDKNLIQSSGGLGFGFFFLKRAENHNSICRKKLYYSVDLYLLRSLVWQNSLSLKEKLQSLNLNSEFLQSCQCCEISNMIMYLHRSLAETSHQLDSEQGWCANKAPFSLKGSGAHHVLFLRAPKEHPAVSHSCTSFAPC